MGVVAVGTGFVTGPAVAAGVIGTTLVALAGSMLKACIQTTAEMSKDAMEYAAYRNDFDNAFSRLFEVLSFQECFKEWRKAVVRISDVDQHEDNRRHFQRYGPEAYVKHRTAQLIEEKVKPDLVAEIVEDEIRNLTARTAEQPKQGSNGSQRGGARVGPGAVPLLGATPTHTTLSRTAEVGKGCPCTPTRWCASRPPSPSSASPSSASYGTGIVAKRRAARPASCGCRAPPTAHSPCTR